MIVYLMRHGQAGAGPDDARELTDAGVQAVEAVARRARRSGVQPSLVVSSTYERARQTAGIAARVLDVSSMECTTALLPLCSPFDAWKDVLTRRPEGDILLVGHEPLLSALAAFLLDSPALKIQVTTAALLAIEVERPSTRPGGVLLWMITPLSA